MGRMVEMGTGCEECVEEWLILLMAVFVFCVVVFIPSEKTLTLEDISRVGKGCSRSSS